MSSTTVLSTMVITCLVIVVLVALAKPLQGLFRFLLSGIFGSALLFLLDVIAYLVVAVTAFNRKPTSQVCQDVELVIKDTVYALSLIHICCRQGA